ncbi:MAG: ABC transporter substrate-binding protein [Propionibacteriaceae bacterium]
MASKHKLGRLALSVLATTAVLASAACGSSSSTTGASSAANDEWNTKGPINYVQGKDTSGNVAAIIAKWNAANPNEKVSLIELSESADEQRAAMIKNAESKGGANYDILSVDVVWTAEFAANGYLAEMPSSLDMSGYLKAAVDSGTYFNKLYAFPSTSDGAMLYYRKDLLTAAGIAAPPKTWDEMKAACAAVKAKGVTIDCYGGQFQKYEGLTCNFAEMVNSAGGEFLSADGKPTVNSAKAVAGVKWAVDAFADGTITKAQLTWKEEESRKAFQDGKLLFLRNWPYVYSLANKTDGSSAVAGKFGVAPIPGLTGLGVSTLGGHNMGISKFTKNKGTALAFVKWWNSAENQKANTIATSNAPTWVALYTDPELTSKFEYLPVLKASIDGAKARPKAVKYGDVTLAIQDAAYGALNGQTPPQAAMDALQTKLEGLVK